jgi:CRP-like cAMP-binding protein
VGASRIIFNIAAAIAADRKDPAMRHPKGPSAVELKSQAAHWLATPSALDSLGLDDAMTVVDYMRPQALAAGEVLVAEGEADALDRMWLVLQGELSVESHALQTGEAELVVRVMGPGSLIGELSLLDGGPGSASCVATTDLLVATLDREDFLRLLAEHPAVGARLLLAMARRMAGHVRDLTRKLQLFAQMNRTLSEALDAPADPTPVVDWPSIDGPDAD